MVEFFFIVTKVKFNYKVEIIPGIEGQSLWTEQPYTGELASPRSPPSGSALASCYCSRPSISHSSASGATCILNALSHPSTHPPAIDSYGNSNRLSGRSGIGSRKRQNVPFWTSTKVSTMTSILPIRKLVLVTASKSGRWDFTLNCSQPALRCFSIDACLHWKKRHTVISLSSLPFHDCICNVSGIPHAEGVQ